MHARSALFDLYGDHLRSRGGQAPVAALVRLLAPLDIAEPAVRTAISRMSRQGWLEPVPLPRGRGYRMTGRGLRRMDEAATRIYRTDTTSWDGCWHLLVTQPVTPRASRERVRAGLGFLGYGRLDDHTWVSPRRSTEVDALLAAEHCEALTLTATDPGPVDRLLDAWELAALAAAYRDWLTLAHRLVSAPGGSDEVDYAVRSQLVHEWRKFLFTDPGLPPQLLPEDWPGHDAARFFDEQSRRLLPAAARFVDHCLTMGEDT